MLETIAGRSIGLALALSLGLPIVGCDASGGAADSGPVACRSDRECSSAGLVCDVASGACVQCVAPTDCATDEACRQHACVAVVACTSSRMCPGQVCDTALGYCVDCVTDVDCMAGQTCSDGTCAAPPTHCASDRDCSVMALVCDRSAGLCVECNASTDCPLGVDCIGHSCGAMPSGDAAGPIDAASAPDAGVDAASSVDAAMIPVDTATGATSGGVHFTWTISDTFGPLSCFDVGMAQVMVTVTPFSGGSGMTRTFQCGDGMGDVTGMPFGGASISAQGNDSSGSFLHSGGGGTITLAASPCDTIVAGSCMQSYAIAFHF